MYKTEKNSGSISGCLEQTCLLFCDDQVQLLEIVIRMWGTFSWERGTELFPWNLIKLIQKPILKKIYK